MNTRASVPVVKLVLNRTGRLVKYRTDRLNMKMISTANVIRVLSATLLVAAVTTNASAQDKAPLKLELPAPTLKGTPEQLPVGPNIEPNSDKAPAALMISAGAKNVALGKTATSSVKPFTGELTQITDGKKEAFDYDTVEMKKGAQWVQVDLGQTYTIEAVAIWHDHRYIQVMHDVIVQVSDDPEFKTGVTTIFNNDTDNSSGLGVGTDREYFERHFGRAFDGKGAKGRYVRGYTKGSHLSALNCWQEIEVYAVPDAAKSRADFIAPTATAFVDPQLPVSSSSDLPTVSVETPAVPTAIPRLQTAATAAPSSAPEVASSVSVQPASPVSIAVSNVVTNNSTKVMVGGSAFLAFALCLIYVLKRNSHPVPNK